MIIDTRQLAELSRPLSTDATMANALIAEAEREDIRPRIGDALYLRITAEGADSDPDINDLLEGCRWNSGCGEHIHYGIRRALAYYAYARIVRDGNVQATRYGSVIKTDDHSRNAEREERRQQYAEMFAQADGYMADILAYLKDNCSRYPEYRGGGVIRSNRVSVRIIGK